MEARVTDEQKVAAAIAKLLGRDVPMTAATRLADELGLDSANLIELTIIVHTMYGVDLGRRAVERKVLPTTVGEVAALLGAA
jgi:acyl carrier protein